MIAQISGHSRPLPPSHQRLPFAQPHRQTAICRPRGIQAKTRGPVAAVVLHSAIAPTPPVTACCVCTTRLPFGILRNRPTKRVTASCCQFALRHFLRLLVGPGRQRIKSRSRDSSLKSPLSGSATSASEGNNGLHKSVCICLACHLPAPTAKKPPRRALHNSGPHWLSQSCQYHIRPPPTKPQQISSLFSPRLLTSS